MSQGPEFKNKITENLMYKEFLKFKQMKKKVKKEEQK
jgi:hypothetical protein